MDELADELSGTTIADLTLTSGDLQVGLVHGSQVIEQALELFVNFCFTL